jgi:hypothetical protein
MTSSRDNHLVKSQRRDKESELKVFIRSVSQKEQVDLLSEKLGVNDITFGPQAIFRILQPKDEYFNIRRHGKDLVYDGSADTDIKLLDSTSLSNVHGDNVDCGSSQWKMQTDEGKDEAGEVQFINCHSGPDHIAQYLAVKDDSEGLGVMAADQMQGDVVATSFIVYVFSVVWTSDPTSVVSDADPDYSEDVWYKPFPSTPSTIASSSSSLIRKEDEKRRTSPVIYRVWLTSEGESKQVVAKDAGGYHLSGSTLEWGRHAEFYVEDAGEGDDVFYLRDKYNKYLCVLLENNVADPCFWEGERPEEVASCKDRTSWYSALDKKSGCVWNLFRVEANTIVLQNKASKKYLESHYDEPRVMKVADGGTHSWRPNARFNMRLASLEEEDTVKES